MWTCKERDLFVVTSSFKFELGRTGIPCRLFCVTSFYRKEVLCYGYFVVPISCRHKKYRGITKKVGVIEKIKACVQHLKKI